MTTGQRDFTDEAVQFLDAILSSASTDVISPKMWWERARTALETAASSSTTYSQLVSRISQKLQIEVLSGYSSEAIARIGQSVGSDFGAFRRQCQRDAIYIAAITRVVRTERNEARKAEKESAR